MPDYEHLCPHCSRPTEDYADHIDRDENTDAPDYPIRWLTRWHRSGEAECEHPLRERFSRSKPQGEYKTIQQERFGIVGDRVCWGCNAVMPEAITKRVDVTERATKEDW